MVEIDKILDVDTLITPFTKINIKEKFILISSRIEFIDLLYVNINAEKWYVYDKDRCNITAPFCEFKEE